MDEMFTNSGLWKHFHWRVLLRWDVLGWILAMLPSAAAILLVFDQYLGANICFMVTAAFLFAKVVHLALTATDPVWHRLVFTFLLFGIIGVGIVETVKGVNRWALKYKVEPTAGVAKPALDKAATVESTALSPAGFITFLGQVINGYAPVMQENQTETPLDDVHLSIFSSVPKSAAPKTDDEWGSGTVVWSKEIEIGTCRARLTTGLQERLPIAGQKYLFFNILMLTRLQTYRETIQLTRESEDQYKAYVRFYGPRVEPLYERTLNLRIVSTAARQQPAAQPEVEMYFVNPKNVEWRIKNKSSSLVIQNVLYWFVLLNIDQARRAGGTQEAATASLPLAFL